VTGTSFPAAQSSQLKITWTDTASGVVTKSEVLWGAAPGQDVPPPQRSSVTIDRPAGNNTFTTPTGLTPGAWYGFKVRDFDVEGFAATGWSVPAVPPPPDPQPSDGVWTFMQTQATDQVELILSSIIGTATLHTDGTFSAPVTIPATVLPGTYELSASLSGQVMAQTPITIIGKGQAPPPVLQVYDPSTGIAYQTAAIVAGGRPVNLRGQNFTPGTVKLWVDSTGGATLGTVTADQNGSFTTQPWWPWNITGAHNVLAEEGSEQATAPVYAEYPAQ